MLKHTPTARRSAIALLAASFAGFFATVAQAHTGADAGHLHDLHSQTSGFWAGLAHPFTGLDHLAAMLAVGLWSGSTARSQQQRLVAPLSFAALLLIGALMASFGLVLPAMEPMIAASLLVLGLLLVSQHGLPASGAALVGSFALFHGAAHGTELAGASALAGMLLATVMLHIAGLALGLKLAQRQRWLVRAGGAAVALLGGALLLA